MNGFEALKKVEEEALDLIITDIMMPVMNGIRLFNSLRKSAVARNVPVVARTAFSREYPAKSLTNMGFSGIIAKPPDKAAVIKLWHGYFPPPNPVNSPLRLKSLIHENSGCPKEALPLFKPYLFRKALLSPFRQRIVYHLPKHIRFPTIEFGADYLHLHR